MIRRFVINFEEEIMKDYRSNAYIDAARMTMWRLAGYNMDDLKKPKIAIVNSSSNLAVCYSHLDDIAKFVAKEIYKSGGISFEVRTVAPVDFLYTGHGGGYIQSSRDLITNEIESMVEGAMLDGIICLASCDKTLPGQLMAGARLNLPTIIVPCGYQPCGIYNGKHFDIDDLYLAMGHYAMGKYTDDEIKAMSEVAVTGPGVCQGIGTANTMHIACEALGFALPGSTPVLANSPKMWTDVAAACKRIVEMVDQDIKSRDLLTSEAFENAVKTVLSVSGSTNSMKHLQAVAIEAQKDINVFEMFDRFADEIPLLVGIRPNGKHFIADMEEAGGTAAVMKQLGSKLNQNVVTVSGKTLEENLADVVVIDEEVIRTVDNAFNYRPGMVLVKGNIAQNFGVIKLQVDDEYKPNYFKGPAKVFNDLVVCEEAIRDGKIEKGDVVVIAGLGLTGTPGMGSPGKLIFALDAVGLGSNVAVITDGHASGLVNMALLVVDVTPEAAVGGQIGLLRDGDIIEIDALGRKIHAEVSDEEFDERRKTAPSWYNIPDQGWLKIYAENVRPINEGAILVR